MSSWGGRSKSMTMPACTFLAKKSMVSLKVTVASVRSLSWGCWEFFFQKTTVKFWKKKPTPPRKTPWQQVYHLKTDGLEDDAFLLGAILGLFFRGDLLKVSRRLFTQLVVTLLPARHFANRKTSCCSCADGPASPPEKWRNVQKKRS